VEEPDEALQGWELAKSAKRTTLKARREPVKAARKSSRRILQHAPNLLHKINDLELPGTSHNTHNAFEILNSTSDDELEEIAYNCDVMLGSNKNNIAETISTMKAEEKLRGAIAEASYNIQMQQKLAQTHVLEGENLTLEGVDNSCRELPEGVLSKKNKSTKLSRKLKRISIK